jgi:hypothetical protein
MEWARFHPNGYEVSSHGDSRYSALFAKLGDGRTIEEAYQLDVKGYRAVSNDWRTGKGCAPLNGLRTAVLWQEYLALWRMWAAKNPILMEELEIASTGKVLTDKFAISPINQARALAVLITERQHAMSNGFTV